MYYYIEIIDINNIKINLATQNYFIFNKFMNNIDKFINGPYAYTYGQIKQNINYIDIEDFIAQKQ